MTATIINWDAKFPANSKYPLERIVDVWVKDRAYCVWSANNLHLPEDAWNALRQLYHKIR